MEPAWAFEGKTENFPMDFALSNCGHGDKDLDRPTRPVHMLMHSASDLNEKIAYLPSASSNYSCASRYSDGIQSGGCSELKRVNWSFLWPPKSLE